MTVVQLVAHVRSLYRRNAELATALGRMALAAVRSPNPWSAARRQFELAEARHDADPAESREVA